MASLLQVDRRFATVINRGALNKFVMRVHPDVVRARDEACTRVNEGSLKELNAFVDCVSQLSEDQQVKGRTLPALQGSYTFQFHAIARASSGAGARDEAAAADAEERLVQITESFSTPVELLAHPAEWKDSTRRRAVAFAHTVVASLLRAAGMGDLAGELGPQLEPGSAATARGGEDVMERMADMFAGAEGVGGASWERQRRQRQRQQRTASASQQVVMDMAATMRKLGREEYGFAGVLRRETLAGEVEFDLSVAEGAQRVGRDGRDRLARRRLTRERAVASLFADGRVLLKEGLYPDTKARGLQRLRRLLLQRGEALRVGEDAVWGGVVLVLGTEYRVHDAAPVLELPCGFHPDEAEAVLCDHVPLLSARHHAQTPRRADRGSGGGRGREERSGSPINEASDFAPSNDPFAFAHNPYFVHYGGWPVTEDGWRSVGRDAAEAEAEAERRRDEAWATWTDGEEDTEDGAAARGGDSADAAPGSSRRRQSMWERWEREVGSQGDNDEEVESAREAGSARRDGASDESRARRRIRRKTKAKAAGGGK